MNYVTNDQAYGFFSKVSEDFSDINGKIPSGASSSNKMVTASDIASKADLVDGKVPSSQLPSYVDDVLEYASTSQFPATGESGKIYVATDTNKTYRWGGSDYVEISESLALGETSSTAYAGDKGKANADAISGIQDLIPSGATTSNKLATASDIPTVPTTDQTYDATSTNPQSGTAVASAISGKADTSDIPTALADLTDDSTHRVVTDTEKTTWSGKQDALTFDNAPTANSNNPVKSGGIKTELDAKMSYVDNGVLGAKNLLKYPYRKGTTTLAGITFADNKDGTLTLSGTASDNADLYLESADWGDASSYRLPNGRYIFRCEGANSNIKVYLGKANTSAYYSFTDGNDHEIVSSDDKPIQYIFIRVNNGTNLSTPVTIKPMLRLATDPDSTYQPYAMTNRELTEMFAVKESAVTNIVSGATAEVNKLVKFGKVVYCTFLASGVTVSAWAAIGIIPEGFRPKYPCRIKSGMSTLANLQASTNGNIVSTDALNGNGISFATTWITD